MNWQPSAEGGGRRGSTLKTKYPLMSQQIIVHRSWTQDNSFPGNLPIEATGILCASNTFKLHSKLGSWVWKSFFANLLYMNACRNLWMVNAVGGAFHGNFSVHLFLALQLDLHCWAVVNEKVTTQSFLEGWRRYEICSLSRCSYILNPLICSMLCFSISS